MAIFFVVIKIVIGTTNMGQVGNYSLAVNGEAIFNKVRVKLYSVGWPDYVFEDNFKLMPLTDVESYIKKEKHLPNVPDAATMQKEGIDVTTTTTMFMQKIEELTLYIIEQNKKIEELQKSLEKITKD